MTVKLVGILLVLCAVTLEALGQISLKKAACGGRRRRWLPLGISFFAAEAVVWTMVLRQLDVSVAYPMGSLSFVAVVMLSRFWLGERVRMQRWAGVALIIAGTALVSSH